MDCPVCKTVTLTMAERQGIEIDYCPQCRGVWLDRGELDKMIDRAVPETAAPAYRPTADSYPNPAPPQQQPGGYDPHYDRDRHYKKKKRGFLGDIFDFD